MITHSTQCPQCRLDGMRAFEVEEPTLFLEQHMPPPKRTPVDLKQHLHHLAPCRENEPHDLLREELFQRYMTGVGEAAHCS